MKNSRSLSTDDLWLLQLYVLIRAATEPVSEETVWSYAERHGLCGITAAKIRRLLRALARRGIIQPSKNADRGFVATRQGKKAAADARARLSNLMSLLDGRSSK
jgi:hypothetical protein